MRRLRFGLLATSALIPLWCHPVAANPLGPNVVAGDVSITGTGTPGVVVDQSSDKAIIDWRSFDIGDDEATTFNQPNANSVVLNRVTGGLGASQILGALKANGQVFLVNPDGILFGKDATVDVGALVATTHDLLDSDFLKGNYVFGLSGNPDASVVNLGKITARDGGFAALVAPGVRNTGTITARLGKVALGSGSSFSLDPNGDGLIKLGVSDDTADEVIDLSTGKPLSALVGNDGSILADGGLVQLSAAATRKVIDSVVNNTGLIEADTVGTKSGKIILSAATSSSKPAGAAAQAVKVSGTLSASGKTKGEGGGSIEITGETIALTEAALDAFGWTGGGSVLVGGDVGGGNAVEAATSGTVLADHVVPTATSTAVDAGTQIDASATQTGDGGKVVVWSDGQTVYDGTIDAEGGANSGNGGIVETSGRQQLAYSGDVDTSALKGETGNLLLDPQDIAIGGSGAWILDPNSIESTLSTSNVLVKTDASLAGLGDITVNSDLDWSSGNALILSAYRNVVVNDGVTIRNTGAGGVGLISGFDTSTWLPTSSGTVLFNGTGDVDWSHSTGFVQFAYNPAGGYTAPTSFGPHVLTNSGVPSQFTPLMWVKSATDLQNVRNNLSGDYVFSNIDLSTVGNFTPIGTSANPFNGLFYGLGPDFAAHGTISNLKINSSASSVGLFGVVGSSGIIAGVNITGSDTSVYSETALATAGILVGTNDGNVVGSSAQGRIESVARGSLTGGLVGWNQGSVVQSSSSANVYTHGTIVDELSPYFGDNGEVGGLVGVNKGYIVQSFATGSVTNLDRTPAVIGGLAGINDADGTIGESYSTASVDSLGCDVNCPLDAPANTVGGFVGVENYGPIIDSYSAGQITGADGAVNGFEGWNVGGAAANTTNVYWDFTTSGFPGLIGSQNDPRARTSGQLTGGLPSGFDPTIWGRDPSYKGGYPYLTWERTPSTLSPLVTLNPIHSVVPNDTSGTKSLHSLISAPSIDWGIAGTTPQTTVVSSPDAVEAFDTVLTFATACADNCLTGLGGAAIGTAVTQLFELTGAAPKITTEPTTYRFVRAGISIAITLVGATAIVAGAPVVVTAAGVAGMVFIVAELTVRPIVGSE